VLKVIIIITILPASSMSFRVSTTEQWYEAGAPLLCSFFSSGYLFIYFPLFFYDEFLGDSARPVMRPPALKKERRRRRKRGQFCVCVRPSDSAHLKPHRLTNEGRNDTVVGYQKTRPFFFFSFFEPDHR